VTPVALYSGRIRTKYGPRAVVVAGAVVLAGTASGITATGSVSYGPHALAAPETGAQLGAAFQR